MPVRLRRWAIKCTALAVLTVGLAPGARAAPFVYVTNHGIANSVSQYDVGAGGALAAKSPPTLAPGSAVGVAVSRDGGSVYVTGATVSLGGGAVIQYDVGAGGLLAPKTPPTVAAPNPFAVAVSPLPHAPISKDQCKNGGYKQFGFKNEGRCVAFVERGPKH